MASISSNTVTYVQQLSPSVFEEISSESSSSSSSSSPPPSAALSSSSPRSEVLQHECSCFSPSTTTAGSALQSEKSVTRTKAPFQVKKSSPDDDKITDCRQQQRRPTERDNSNFLNGHNHQFWRYCRDDGLRHRQKPDFVLCESSSEDENESPYVVHRKLLRRRHVRKHQIQKQREREAAEASSSLSSSSPTTLRASFTQRLMLSSSSPSVNTVRPKASTTNNTKSSLSNQDKERQNETTTTIVSTPKTDNNKRVRSNEEDDDITETTPSVHGDSPNPFFSPVKPLRKRSKIC